jgi:hypothetical protein
VEEEKEWALSSETLKALIQKCHNLMQHGTPFSLLKRGRVLFEALHRVASILT